MDNVSLPKALDERQDAVPHDEAVKPPVSALPPQAEPATTVLNLHHVMLGVVARSWRELMTERELRHRAFFAACELGRVQGLRLDETVEPACHAALCDDNATDFEDAINFLVQSGLLRKHDGQFLRGNHWRRLPQTHPVQVCAREIEAASNAQRPLARAAWLPHAFVARRVRQILVEKEKALFRDDYEKHFQEGMSKDREVGVPFLLKPLCPIGGVVLIHGYMAAPLEVRALADFLFLRRYAVYGVRLRGHGTSPADLNSIRKEDWYKSIGRACAIVRTITDDVIVGGFSMGAGLALLTAATRKNSVKAVFAINAPLHLRNPAAKFATSVVRVNALLRRFRGKARWEYLENAPENKHINYTSNPVTGVAELREAMAAMENSLKDIIAPALVLQASRDPLVHPGSGPAIFEKIGTPYKELMVMERSNHGIINGPRSKEVFERVWQFLAWVRAKSYD